MQVKFSKQSETCGKEAGNGVKSDSSSENGKSFVPFVERVGEDRTPLFTVSEM